MVKKSRQQLIIKICCFIAAFVLWLYTSNDEATSKTYKISNIAVEIVNEDVLTQSGLTLSPNQNFTTSLKITGMPSELYSVKADEFKITADVGAYALKKGSNRIPINIVKRPNKNINIINDGSMWMTIQVDDYVEKSFQVKSRFNGDSKNGFYKEPPIITPDNVVVSGAKQYVDKVDGVFAEIKIDNSDKNINMLAPLKALDKTGREIPEVQISPKFVDVVVPIQKTKQVGLNIKTKGKLKSGLTLKAIKPKYDKVVITGDPKDLVAIEKIDTEPIDLSHITPDKSYVKLNLIIPSGIKLIKEEQSISAQVVLDTTTEKNIGLKIEVKNVKKGFIAKLDNYNLSLKISGTKTLVDSIKNSDIQCFVNLESLEEGEYTIPVNIKLPSGINKVSQSIEFAKVVISKEVTTSKPEDGNGNSNTNSNGEGTTNTKPTSN
ncbi:CdaR family protein [Clostridium brassicae]|uniref:CdaR family protein n=1 Tax=Clostridium brassicae TaxID=2999072 RepID=A0ABT4D549_9CLOT|nr:CdaR family protein [Clostridium brassicae]MCY6957414.1 CdaR family protein [Clostridium brassicae]